MKNEIPNIVSNMKEIERFADDMLEAARDRELAPRDECLKLIEHFLKDMNESGLPVQVEIALLLQTACALFQTWMDSCQRLN